MPKNSGMGEGVPGVVPQGRAVQNQTEPVFPKRLPAHCLWWWGGAGIWPHAVELAIGELDQLLGEIFARAVTASGKFWAAAFSSQ